LLVLISNFVATLLPVLLRLLAVRLSLRSVRGETLARSARTTCIRDSPTCSSGRDASSCATSRCTGYGSVTSTCRGEL
jgi:hypothetical protein